MRRTSRIPAGRRAMRWVWTRRGAVLVMAASVGLFFGRGVVAGFWVAVGAAITAQWAARRGDDCRVLAALPDVPVQRIATAVALLPPVSTAPLRDLARIRALGAGIVQVDGEPPRVLTAAHAETLELDTILTGRWDRLAMPATILPGEVNVDLLRSLPDDGEAWLVARSPTYRVLTGDALRAAAATGAVTPPAPVAAPALDRAPADIELPNDVPAATDIELPGDAPRPVPATPRRRPLAGRGAREAGA